jgi:cell division cycle 14
VHFHFEPCCNTPLSSFSVHSSSPHCHHLRPPLMAPMCEPLCYFGDRSVIYHFKSIRFPNRDLISARRLYFTTFPHPPPTPQVLNRLSGEPGNQPRIRARPRGGPSASPDDSASYYYFTIDDQLLYLSFFQDWGPLNIAMVYKACILIHELLEVCQGSSTRICRMPLT